MNMNRLHFLVIAGALISTQMVWAAGPTASEEPTIGSLTPAEVASGALTPQVQGGVHFVSGGIGIEERAWLAAHAPEFNTHLTFAVVPGGEFVSDVHVRISDAKGTPILEATSDGPQMFVQLPVGHYQVEATHDGQTIKRSFTVADKRSVQITIGFKK
ncbi:MAG: carboxypeptidase regulatory-like domain-containing protein [Halothiobacillus sp.]|nr:carboxypeptidase regulatory-like domain-containing protein [Halothiobacillus sp.]